MPGPKAPSVPNRTWPPDDTWAKSSRLVPSATSIGPIMSRQASTRCSGVMEGLWARIRSIMERTPGLSTSENCCTAKSTRFDRFAVVIHSFPVYQPSTLGGSMSFCPMLSVCVASSVWLASGISKPPAIRAVPTTSSAGLLTRAKVAFLKKSELNSTRRTEQIL